MPGMARDPLPIDGVLPELLAKLNEHGAAVLRAPTGAGKTTRVPPVLVEAGLPGRVLLLEPRRVAARAAARRMAFEHGSPLGEVFGYQVRFDRKAGPRTRVLAVTPGVLLRFLHDDPYLESTAAVVFDEFHERGLESDLALGLVRLIRQTVRPDLRVVVMSATIDPGPVSVYLGGCPAVTSEGRMFPVEVRYRPKRPEVGWPEAAASAVRGVLGETDGDVLVFLPGLREIRQTADELGDLTADGVAVLPLHGDLPPEQQDRALQKLDRRKVVLATNVAETSVTVEGVTAVVDTGLARQMEFDPSVGMDRLRLVPVSRASADQRAGRAGRTRPGVCVRLWDEAGQRSRPEQIEPEIRRVDLAGAVLQLLALGEADVDRFPWLDPPRPEAVGQALELLRRLGAVEGGRLTDVGRAMARLPVHPRVARLLIEGQRLGHPDRAALAAALLAERDPFVREFDAGPPVRTAPPTASDVLDRVEALEAFEATGRPDGPLGRLHRGGAWGVLQARDQLRRMLEGERRTTPSSVPSSSRTPTGSPGGAGRGTAAPGWSAAAGCGSPRPAVWTSRSCSSAWTWTPAGRSRWSGWRRRSAGSGYRPRSWRQLPRSLSTSRPSGSSRGSKPGLRTWSWTTPRPTSLTRTRPPGCWPPRPRSGWTRYCRRPTRRPGSSAPGCGACGGGCRSWGCRRSRMPTCGRCSNSFAAGCGPWSRCGPARGSTP